MFAGAVGIGEDIERWLSEVMWVWWFTETENTVFDEAEEAGRDCWIVAVSWNGS